MFLKKALRAYRLAYWLGFIYSEFRLYTDLGFCKFFYRNYCRDISDFYILEETAIKELGDTHGYWYKPGKLGPRIELLKKALKSVI